LGTNKQTFIKGTMILLAAGVINRVLGFVPRIALPRVIGAEGVGLYQMGYPFLIVILTLITGGVPLAVAKLVAEAESEGNERRVRGILTLSLFLMIVLGIAFMAVCIIAAPWITTYLLTDSRVYYTFLSMSPIIPIVGVSSVYRGYFQGRHNMIPTASSQIVETIVRIVAMLSLAYVLLPRGIEYAAAGAMLGVVAGELCGMAVLLLHYNKSKAQYVAYHKAVIGEDRKRRHMLANFRKLLKISVPVTGSRLVGSCSYFLESIMIVQSLALAGVATAVATAQYGTLQGMVIPILLLPGVLTYSLSVSLVPSLSEAAARNDMKTIHKRLHQSLRLALVTGAPFAVAMYVLSDPLTYFLYNDTQVGSMLKMMAPVAMFYYFQGPLNATLQALDKPGTALLNTFIGASIKLMLIYQLASNPQFGIEGAVIAINVNIALVTILHWNSVVKMLKFSMKLGDFIKVGLAMVMMGGCSYFVMNSSWNDAELIRFLSAGFAGVVVYLLAIVFMKLIDKQDLVRVPWIGSKLNKWM
jgi:stage V sporulation protein B